MNRFCVLTEDGLEIQNRNLEEQESETACKMRLAGVCGTDVHALEGELGLEKPVLLGHENIAEISEETDIKTANNKKLKSGDKVVFGVDVTCKECWYCENMPEDRKQLCENCFSYGFDDIGYGGWGEKLMLKPGSYVLKAGEKLSDQELILLDSLASTWGVRRGLEMEKNEPIEHATILGAGIIGVLSSIRLQMRGISTTIIGGPKYRADIAKDFADQVMTRQIEFEKRKEKIKDFNEGRKSDMVIDTAGTSKALKQSVEYVRKGGTIVEIGGFYHASDNSISPEDLVFGDLYVVGQYGYPPIEYSKSLELLRDISERYEIGKLVTHELNLDELENLTDKDFYREKKYMKIAVNPQK